MKQARQGRREISFFIQLEHLKHCIFGESVEPRDLSSLRNDKGVYQTQLPFNTGKGFPTQEHVIIKFLS